MSFRADGNKERCGKVWPLRQSYIQSDFQRSQVTSSFLRLIPLKLETAEDLLALLQGYDSV